MWEARGAALAVRRRRARRHRFRRWSAASASSTLLARRARRASAGARAAARDAGRRARDRQEPAGGRAVRRSSRRDPELITWRQGRCLPYGDGVTLLGAGRDGEGAGRDARDGLGRGGGARSCTAPVDGARRRPDRGGLGRGPSAASGRARRGAAAAASAAARRSPPGGASSRRWPSSGRSCSSSRICTGPTTACSTSSTSSSTGRRACRCSSSARPGRSCSSGAPAGAAASANAVDAVAVAAVRRGHGAADRERCSSRPCCPAEMQQRCCERAEGNPLYAEEYVAHAQDRGCCARADWRLEELPLPETVQGIIAARLDALARRGEGAAPGRGRGREGVLAGPVAAIGGIVRLGGGGAAARARAQGVRAPRARSSSVAGETEYAFRHVLVRDVAYGQIPRARARRAAPRAAGGSSRSARAGRGPCRDARPPLPRCARVDPGCGR